MKKMVDGFEIVSKGGAFYIFEGLEGAWIVCVKTRKEAEKWIKDTISARAELKAHKEAIAAIHAEARAELKARIEAARAAAPKQLDLFSIAA